MDGTTERKELFWFRDAEDSKVGFPLVKPVQRIMIRTQISWNRGDGSNGLLEHPTQGVTVDDTGVDAEADNPARVVVHDHQHPMRP